MREHTGEEAARERWESEIDDNRGKSEEHWKRDQDKGTASMVWLGLGTNLVGSRSEEGSRDCR